MAQVKVKKHKTSPKEKVIEGLPMMRRNVAGGHLGSKSHGRASTIPPLPSSAAAGLSGDHQSVAPALRVDQDGRRDFWLLWPDFVRTSESGH
jgi:hypothetical protein